MGKLLLHSSALLAAGFLAIGAAGARQANEVTPEVQQLYAEAHAALTVTCGDTSQSPSPYRRRPAPHVTVSAAPGACV
jgi:hypothetical protein